ncbi:hypothetical protein C8R44DRAFT_380318 [Mycena epipterygia]|nr:hypothetical protein C8R44DRAFT_380318 [Mycena epipterygia]
MKEPKQLPQELVDYIISLLHDSPADWPVCALVSRAWVYGAQSHIFGTISFMASVTGNERRCVRFQETHDAAPHLIRHVRQLKMVITDREASAKTLLAISKFPFTHVQHLHLRLYGSNPARTLALQQLLSLPTLCRLQMEVRDCDAQTFYPVWERCSSRLRHVELELEIYSKYELNYPQPRPVTVRLESLDLRTSASVGLCHWLIHPRCPFDFSGLKHLSIWTHTELLDSQNFAPALRTMQTLDFTPDGTKPTLDLSAFPSLTVLRIQLFPEIWPWFSTTLSTITASTRIVKIIIVARFLDGLHTEEFDSQVSGLPNSPIVEFERSPSQIDLKPRFPLLSSATMFRCAAYDYSWFQVSPHSSPPSHAT